MGTKRFWQHLQLAMLAVLCMTVAAAGHARGSGEVTGDARQEVEAQGLNQSLANVIQVLENDEQRAELLAQLKGLRESRAALAAAEGQATAGDNALAMLSRILGVDSQGQGATVVASWKSATRDAVDRVRTLWSRASSSRLWWGLAGFGMALALGLGLLLLLTGLGYWLFRRKAWPLQLPPEPDAATLTLHLLRRFLPWLGAFAILLAVVSRAEMPNSVSTAVVVVAYAALCGRLLSTVFDGVISRFTRGHRRAAVAVLRRKALQPLFLIGALLALGDAVKSEYAAAQLGEALAGWLSVVISVVAGLISAWLVARVRRPVAHMIRNRSYSRRHVPGAPRDIRRILANIWHVPVLLAIAAVLVAAFLDGGDSPADLASVMVCSVFLVLTLVATGFLRRYAEARSRVGDRTSYHGWLERVGYALGHLAVWAVFIELSLRVWGLSLFGIGGSRGIGSVFGQALLGLGLTLLAGWVAWTFAETAIHRALHKGSRRINTTRARTIAPMLRNIVFGAILVITVIAALANVGVNVTPLLAGAGVIGLAVGFGAQSLVQDLITGIFILIEDSLVVGDFVEINGYMGSVEGLTLRTMRLRDLDGVLHVMTFSHIGTIHNMSRDFGIALIKIRIPHDLPIDDAIELMRSTGAELQADVEIGGLIRSPLEMQGVHAFEDGCPVLRMRFRTVPEYQWDVARAFNLLLKQRMEARSVDLAAARFSISMEGQGGRQTRGGDRAEVAADAEPRPREVAAGA